MKHIPENEKLSLAECRKILNKGKKKYSDEQIQRIREVLYLYTELTLEFVQQKTPKELTDLMNLFGEKK